MKLARAILPLLLCAGALPAASDTLTDFFPINTRVVFGIRVHNLVLSPVVQSFKKQAEAAGAGWLNLSLEGFDLLRDIDEVLIASDGRGQNPQALIVVAGRFDVARLGHGAERYHGVPLIGSPKDGNSVVALLDASTVLVGTPALVHAAIDHRGDKPAIDPALNDRITSLRQRYDIWGLGEEPGGFKSPVPQAKALESIDRFQFGMQLSNGLELGAEAHARTPEDAAKLKESLGLLAGLLKPQMGAKSGAKFDFQTTGDTFKLSVSIPEAELKKAIETHSVPVTRAGPPTVTPAADAPAQSTHDQAAAPGDAPKRVESQVRDKTGNTVILTLPGKK